MKDVIETGFLIVDGYLEIKSNYESIIDRKDDCVEAI